MIKEILDTYIQVKEEAKKTRVRSGKFSPSLFGSCLRRQIWNRQDKPISNPPDDRSLRVFECGHIFHKFIQDLLPTHQVEVEVEEDDVKGFADIVTEGEVIDIKSQHSKAFWYSKRVGYDIKKEKRNNIMQVCYYALKLNKPIGRLVFMSKDDLCMDEWTFTATQWEDAINRELETLRMWWEAEKDPPAVPRLYNGSECKFCNFKDACAKQEGKFE